LVDESANWIASGDVPEVIAEIKDATGAATVSLTVMYPDSETVLLPSALVVVRVTVYVPADEKVCEGFCSVDVPPSPKDHAHDVGELADESTNCTVSGAVPVVIVDTNEPTGAAASAGIAMVSERVVTRKIARKSIFMVDHPGFPASCFVRVMVPAWLHLNWRLCFVPGYLRSKHRNRENLHTAGQ
jgi:hypothetical protein